MEKFVIVKDTVKNNNKFRLSGRTLEVKNKSIPYDAEPVRWVKQALEGREQHKGWSLSIRCVLPPALKILLEVKGGCVFNRHLKLSLTTYGRRSLLYSNKIHVTSTPRSSASA